MSDTTKKIIWLASYPKSGNTWFRAFITALLNEGEVDINGLKTDGIFSSRKLFDEATDLDSTLLYDTEAKMLQGEVFNYIVCKKEQERIFIKVHDAYIFNTDNSPIIPADCTQCAIYFIRNPLDIVASLANHKNDTIDDAVELMNNTGGAFSKQERNLNTKTQFKQVMLDWSGHVASWTANLPFPVLVLRYEDMLADTFTIFNKAIKFMNIDAGTAQVESAIAASSFDRLKQKENEKGFNEKTRSNAFFRNGKAGNWKNELNEQQADAIISHHKTVMKKYGY